MGAARWRHPRLANAGLVFVSLLATFALFEGVARATRYHGPGKEAGTVAQYTEFDPLLGWRKRPGGFAKRRTAEYSVDVSINGLGLRDKERRYAAAPGTFRVLALGDSFVEAYSVPLESSLTQVLERSLAGGIGSTEVINGGTAGYSTDQEYLFYSAEGRRYRPNVVLLFFYFNDVLFNGRSDYYGSPTPLFKIDQERLVPPALLVAPEPRDAGSATPRPPAAREPDPLGLASLAWLDDRLTNGAPLWHERLARFGLWEAVRRQLPHLQLRVYKRKRIRELEADWDLTARLLHKLAQDVAEDGADFALVYVPSLMEVDERAWELSRLRYGMDDDGWDRGRVRERLREIAAGRFPLLDLTASLRAADRGLFGGPYFARDGHWNELGHRVVAEQVRLFLADAGWLPSRHPSRRPRRTRTRPRLAQA